jgi:hypothetical protein
VLFAAKETRQWLKKVFTKSTAAGLLSGRILVLGGHMMQVKKENNVSSITMQSSSP